MPDGNPELPPVSPSDGNLDDNKDDDDPDSKRRYFGSIYPMVYEASISVISFVEIFEGIFQTGSKTWVLM